MERVRVTKYLEHAQRWADGMAAAESYTDERRRAAAAVGTANRMRGDCPMPGCNNTSYRGGLCRKHLKQVPMTDKIQLTVELLRAQQTITRKHHRRWARQMRQEWSASA